ncbi:methionyl-tRNA formyltransferase [Amycolatopsis xylanica]|uniref:Methionyl-tRNA formyltransferase n=1 Tax=Amycolatopsis xylanica TaxID=589385 RepID=A0A1H3GNX3_9PSEU|nr:formyltransferase family protein [Amycolatopsis xylanica]SDY05016.1 methionyl-tRNA formyltransferase [Amycolatopsis xylanica]
MTAPAVVLFSFGPEQFSMLHHTCEAAGYTPVACVYCRSKKPHSPTSAEVGEGLGQVLGDIPPGMDLLVPGSSEGLLAGLAGYRPDLFVVYGFSWRLPPEVLRLPRLGVLNIHASALPRYRGPAPVLAALRNGDRTIGVTVHRMNERFDAGPILAQRDGIPLDEDIDAARLWKSLNPIVGDLLTTALALGDGEPQDETKASYAGFLEPEFSVVDWSRPARVIHNQVRTWRFIGAGLGPVATLDGDRVTLLRTRLEPGEGVEVNCGDGPLWIVESAPPSPS